MKYIKHYYVDAGTLEPVTTNQSVSMNGKTHPPVPNLNVRFWLTDVEGVDVCYSTTNEDVDVSGILGVTELTREEWFNDLLVDFVAQKEKKKNQVFGVVQRIKAEVIDKWWHHSEITAAMTIKVNESQLAIAAEDEAAARNVAPFLTIEADARQITVKDLAARVIANYNGMIAGEALLSGHRGLLCDQIDQIAFDDTDIDTVNQSYGQLNNFKIAEGFKEIRTALGL